jgi:hypothetical protein
MTVGELIQMAGKDPGAAEDSYEVTGIGDNVSVTTSSALAELGRAKAISEMKRELSNLKIRNVSPIKEIDR